MHGLGTSSTQQQPTDAALWATSSTKLAARLPLNPSTIHEQLKRPKGGWQNMLGPSTRIPPRLLIMPQFPLRVPTHSRDQSKLMDCHRKGEVLLLCLRTHTRPCNTPQTVQVTGETCPLNRHRWRAIFRKNTALQAGAGGTLVHHMQHWLQCGVLCMHAGPQGCQTHVSLYIVGGRINQHLDEDWPRIWQPMHAAGAPWQPIYAPAGAELLTAR